MDRNNRSTTYTPPMDDGGRLALEQFSFQRKNASTTMAVFTASVCSGGGEWALLEACHTLTKDHEEDCLSTRRVWYSVSMI
jgi:hypothetical protein